MATQRPILFLGPGDSGRSLSAEEFEEAEFEPRWRYEREKGRLVVMPPDSPEHDLSSEPMRDYLVLTGWLIPNSWNGSSRNAGSAWIQGRIGSGILASSSSVTDQAWHVRNGFLS